MSHDYWPEIFEVAAADDVDALRRAIEPIPALSRVRDKDGTSLVLFCVYRARVKCLDALAARASEFTLHEAAATGREERCRALLESSPWAIDMLSPDGWTALHL